MNKCSSLRWAWALTRGRRMSILFSILIGVIKVILGLLFVWLSKQVIDIAVADREGNIGLFSIFLVSTLVVEIGCSALQGSIDVKNEAILKNNLRGRFFSRVLNSRWEGTERHHTGEVMNRLEEDVRVVADTCSNVLPATVSAALQAVGAFAFLAILEPALAWLVLCIFPLILVMIKVCGGKLKMLTEEIRKSDGHIQALMQESLQKRVILLSLLRTRVTEEHLKKEQDVLYEKTIRRNRFTVFNRMLIMIGFGGGYLTAFLWGAWQMRNGLVTFGMLTAFLQLVGLLQRPILDLGRRLPGLIHALASVSRLGELAGLEQEKHSLPVSGKTVHLCGIRMKDVYYAYPQAVRRIFHSFNYDFKPGTMTAIMGETGVGKSTLTRLILGLLQPQQGSVVFYDKHGKEYPASPFTRQAILYVPQGNSLISGTIRANLLAGNEEADEGQMLEALYHAAAEFVTELPGGLDTFCGEGGAGLSEGQAQRIAIARALLSKGEIMLLDEFSSALDSDTEKRLMQRLQTSGAGKTVIIVTHKQEVADMCGETVRLTRID